MRDLLFQAAYLALENVQRAQEVVQVLTRSVLQTSRSRVKISSKLLVEATDSRNKSTNVSAFDGSSLQQN
eukprot:scaffold19336_cov16-Tisochrysis_lutea.AAC.1